MPTLKEVEAAARALCVEAGDNPDAIGEPPNDKGYATADHAFPRWMLRRRQARVALEAAEAVRIQHAAAGEAP